MLSLMTPLYTLPGVTLSSSPALLRDQSDFPCRKNHHAGWGNHVIHSKMFLNSYSSLKSGKVFSESGRILCRIKQRSRIDLETKFRVLVTRFVSFCLGQDFSVEHAYRALNFSFTTWYDSKTHHESHWA